MTTGTHIKEKPPAAPPIERFYYFCATVVTIFAAIIIGWAVNQGFEQFQSYKWPTINGLIKGSLYLKPTGVRKFSRPAILKLSYEYVVENKTYHSSQYRFWSEDYRGEARDVRPYALHHEVGDWVEVYYDPKNPGTSVLKPGPDWNSLGLIILGSVCFPLFGWLYILSLRRAKCPADGNARNLEGSS